LPTVSIEVSRRGITIQHALKMSLMNPSCFHLRARISAALKCQALIICLVVSAGIGKAAPLPSQASVVPELEKGGLTALDQGDRDDCSLFAITGVAELESFRRPATPHERLSEEYLIWASRQFSGNKDDQAMFYEAVAGLNALGVCPAEAMPYARKPDLSLKPSPEAIEQARELRERWNVHWIKRWSVDSRLSEQELDSIKAALAKGHAVACGLRWPKDLKGSALLAPPKPDQVFDGHSIMLVGYEDAPGGNGGKFTFRNSSGPGWGENGYGTISYAYARTYANDALWLQLGPPGSEVPAKRYEAETMAVADRKHCEVHPQKMSDFGGRMWSGGAQLFCGFEKGGVVELTFDVEQAGRYRLRALATAAPDFGIVRVVIDEDRMPRLFDLYSGRVCPAGALELGTYDLAVGRHRIRFTSVAKNPSSKGFAIGLDAIDLMTPKQPG